MLEGVLASVLNRFLSSYVEGLNTSSLNVGIWSGDINLRNLRLKTSALDKFRLPIDVKEGYLGDLKISIPWTSLRNRPVRVAISNVFLIAAPKEASAEVDEDEEEERAQAAKQEKLANAELLGRDVNVGVSAEDAQKTESFTNSLVTKIVDNLQITVKNIHIRYEDKLSNPEHPFSAGITLAEFSAVSTDSEWNPTFIQNSAEGIHKLARLESLAAYWDTDAGSLAGHEVSEAQSKFNALIARDGEIPDHQYILKPVSGAGRMIVRRKMTNEVPKLDAQLLFEELGFALDDEQYRDVISVTDLFHFYTRQAQYRRFRPSAEELEENRPRALLKFAGRAILNEVHEKRKVWTWEYFAQRRDERREYVALFKDKEQQTNKQNQQQAGVSTAQAAEGSELAELERKLSYKDIRFYRSIARNELRKERASRKRDEAATASHAQQGGGGGGGWLGWIWGGNKGQQGNDSSLLNDEQRKELYDAIEWDESQSSAALAQAVDLPADVMKMRVTAKLQTGSLALKDHGRGDDILSLVFDSLRADVVQRVDNLEAALSLGGLRVYDGTSPNSLHPQIVRIKDDEGEVERKNSAEGTMAQIQEAVGRESDPSDPFFYLKFENKPLDRRADNALTVRMKSAEIIYHRGYVEAIVAFFKPPESELELIGALIDVASETLEGIRKETRAGLENALENHKTIDVSLDVKAPLIIVAEDITQERCQHIVIDAGRIDISSVMADQGALDTVRSKQKQQYSEADYKQLEELMYDRFFVKLEAAQLVMGPDLASCLRSLRGDNPDGNELHLLERINLDFTIHNSILPKAPNLTKFKLTGHLPALRVNFSDQKYHTLMSIIDAAIPQFEEEGRVEEVEVEEVAAAATHTREASTNRLDLARERRSRAASSMRRSEDYLVDHDDDEDADFQDAEDATADRINARQKTFELEFVVDALHGSIYKSATEPGKPDRLLVEAHFEGFFLHLSIFPYHMEVDVGLRSLEIEDRIVEEGAMSKHLITSKPVDDGTSQGGTDASAAASDKDLVRVKYVRVQQDSPEFQTVYEGIDQSVSAELSTINIMLTRVSVLVMYDWIMKTFVPEEGGEAAPAADGGVVAAPKKTAAPAPARKEMLRVRVKLTSIVLRLNDDGALLATLRLSTADVAVVLRGETMRVAARLGSLVVLDNTPRKRALPEFAKLVSLEGEDDVIDFSMETFDAADASYPGYDSSIWLRSGSLRVVFVEDAIRDLLQFFSKFAQMNAVYSRASAAASAQAAQFQEKANKQHLDIQIASPLAVFPRHPGSSDVLTLNLGQLEVFNSFPPAAEGEVVTKMEAALRHIRLSSRLRSGSHDYHVQMIDDVNVTVDMTTQQHLNHAHHGQEPDTQIVARMSDVQIKLTEQQYGFIMALTASVPRAFTLEEGELEEEEQAVPVVRSDGHVEGAAVDMLPELGTVAHVDDEDVPLHAALDLLFSVKTINLELFSAEATAQESLPKASIARFALNGSEVKLKMLSDSSLEAEVALKSFTVADTRPIKETKFREIIPAVRHDGHQFMMSYTKAGGADASALALITIDSPKIIFSLDPVFALLNFFTSAFVEGASDVSVAAPAPAAANKSIAGASTRATTTAAAQQQLAASQEQPAGALSFRLNVVDPTIILLAAPERSDTQAIVLSIRQLLMSQQAIMALKVDSLGMFMCRMDRPKETLRFLDNFDLTMSLDSRGGGSHQITSIEIDVDPLVLRVSYRDVMLIQSVINKAIELSNKGGGEEPVAASPEPRRQASAISASSAEVSKPVEGVSLSERQAASSNPTRSSANADRPEIVLSREILKANVASLQVILIGDAHSLPMMDLHVRKFQVDVRDWSADMSFKTTLATYINYYNLSRSHWEPLFDPWSVDIGMDRANGTDTITISSKRRLELNVTTTLIETAMTAVATMGDDNVRASAIRDSQAPFRIRNRTGYKITLWAEREGKVARASNGQALEDGEDVPWRFDDMKTMREHAMDGSVSNSLSVQIEGMPWERIKHLSVNSEGDFVVALRPKLERVAHRMLCEVKLQDNVKVVTLRSSLQVENSTMVPVEMVVLAADGSLTDMVRKIAPGELCPVPIEAAYHSRIKLRPDPGFEYGWSDESLHWQELVKRSTRTLSCRSNDAGESPFRFQCYTMYDRQDPLARVYPKLTLRLRAPVEIENLLPYDIQYRIFDKNLNHNWSSYLRKGGISPIHVVEISHLLLLSVDIQSSVFSPSEFAIIATDNGDDFPVEKTLTLADAENLKLNLRLQYVKYPDSGGAFKVQIYAPYIFVNQSGLPFALKTKSWIGGAKLVAGQDSGQSHEMRKSADPFLFSHNTNDRRNRVQLRVGDSVWSRPLSFEAIGSESEVVIPSAGKNEEIHLGLTIEDGLGKFRLSKVIKLTPRYVVRNHLDEAIRLREAGAADFTNVEAGSRVPLHFLRVGAAKQLTVAYPGLNNKWTAPMNLEDIGTVYLRIAKAGHHQHLLKVDILLEGPTIFISISQQRGAWPFMLRNESDYTVTFMQAAEGATDDSSSKRYELKPRSKMKYAWDYPALGDKLIKLVANGRERNVDILEIGSLLPFKFPSADGRGNRVLSLDVRADGPTQTLVISNYSESLSNYKLKRQGTGLSRSDTVNTTMSSRDGGFEAVDVDTRVLSAFNLELEGIGISLINRSVQELAYLSFRGLEVHYTESELTTALGVVVKWIQLDNQLFGGLFPIVLYPTVTPKDGKELEIHPTLQLSLVRLKDTSHGVVHWRYASLLIQEFSVELDEDFLFALYDFSKLHGPSWQADPDQVVTDFIENPREVPEPEAHTTAQDVQLYIELLHLQPLAINLSFMRTERINQGERVSSRNPLFFIANTLTMAIGNLNEAPIRLSALLLENCRTTQEDLVGRLLVHYRQSAIFSIHRVLGSLDIVGNPVGLFTSVSSGLQSLYYEPYQGLLLGGPKGVGLGILKGGASFAQQTLGGLTSSASRITGAISSGLASATLDPEFQSKRRRVRNKPRHVLYGASMGASAFFNSVASGLEGLALRPLEGAEQGGAVGFLKGAGKGLVGAFVKPAVGAFDLVSNVTEGVRNTTQLFEEELDRVRLPRFIASDGIVRPYSDREALGQVWLKGLDGGRLISDHYVAHIDSNAGGRGENNVLLLTRSRILLAKVNRLKVVWEVPLSDLASISLESEGLQLTLRGGVQGPFLRIETSGRMWFFRQCSRVVAAHNAAAQGAQGG